MQRFRRSDPKPALPPPNHVALEVSDISEA